MAPKVLVISNTALTDSNSNGRTLGLLQAAFSTKIADSLASGVPLLLFAPETFSETKYLLEAECAVVCTDSMQLKQAVETALNDKQRRLAVVSKAQKTAAQNHDSQKNQRKMYEIICSVKGVV